MVGRLRGVPNQADSGGAPPVSGSALRTVLGGEPCLEAGDGGQSPDSGQQVPDTKAVEASGAQVGGLAPKTGVVPTDGLWNRAWVRPYGRRGYESGSWGPTGRGQRAGPGEWGWSPSHRRRWPVTDVAVR